MKYLKIAILYVIAQSLLISCKKEDNKPATGGGALLTIVNATIGSSALVTNFNSNQVLKYYNTAQKINYGAYVEFPNYMGMIPLSLSQITDTVHTLYNHTLNLSYNTAHTLFMTGLVAQPDTLYTTDKIPYYPPTDSVLAVRFVNLSPGSSPMTVNLQGQQSTPQVSSLAYKAITDFQQFPAKSTIIKYVFEVRAAGTGSLLTTYTLTPVSSRLFKNVTLAVIGNSSTGVKTLLINNY